MNDRQDLEERAKAFALRAVRLVEALPRGSAADVMGKQLLRCATSVGANYRAACRARSRAEFVAKLGIVEEEADEVLYWMELLIDDGLVEEHRLIDLMQEGNELLGIIITSIKTARSNHPYNHSRLVAPNHSAFQTPHSTFERWLIS